MQCFVGTQKNRLNETLIFVYSNAYFFVRLGLSVRLEENNYFDSFLFATKRLLAQTTESLKPARTSC